MDQPEAARHNTAEFHPPSSLQVKRQEAQEEELITLDAIGCFEGEEYDEVEVADEDEGEAGSSDILQVLHSQTPNVHRIAKIFDVIMSI